MSTRLFTFEDGPHDIPGLIKLLKFTGMRDLSIYCIDRKIVFQSMSKAEVLIYNTQSGDLAMNEDYEVPKDAVLVKECCSELCFLKCGCGCFRDLGYENGDDQRILHPKPDTGFRCHLTK